MRDKWSINELISICIQEEGRMKISHLTMAMPSKKDNKKSNKRFKFQKGNHHGNWQNKSSSRNSQTIDLRSMRLVSFVR